VKLIAVPPGIPRTHGVLTPVIGRLVLRVLGWRVTGELPDVRKLVVIVAPHTSNWDFVVGLALKWALRARASWLGKHTLFRGPWAPFFRGVGGIPVNRSISQDVVPQSVAAFGRVDTLLLALAPEGTRSRVPRWRTGFWHIAKGAGVPIVPVCMDRRRRVVHFGPTFHPDGDADLDIRRIRDWYAAQLKHP
jgi:1-acyl-sn-glycerol-3-phosphate acyltransferase